MVYFVQRPWEGRTADKLAGLSSIFLTMPGPKKAPNLIARGRHTARRRGMLGIWQRLPPVELDMAADEAQSANPTAVAVSRHGWRILAPAPSENES